MCKKRGNYENAYDSISNERKACEEVPFRNKRNAVRRDHLYRIYITYIKALKLHYVMKFCRDARFNFPFQND